MRKIGLLAALLSVCLVSTSFAHDASFGSTADPIDLTGWSGTGETDLIHYDAAGWKGWAEFTVENSMLDDWGDFHIKLNSYASVDSVYITEDINPAEIVGWDSSDYSVTYTDDNAYGARQVNFEFYGNPVKPNDVVTFRVYTNNEADQNEWFGFCIYPTPVPEPATLAMLGLGGLAMLRRKR